MTCAKQSRLVRRAVRIAVLRERKREMFTRALVIVFGIFVGIMIGLVVSWADRPVFPITPHDGESVARPTPIERGDRNCKLQRRPCPGGMLTRASTRGDQTNSRIVWLAPLF